MKTEKETGHKIIIEPLLRENSNKETQETDVYCFHGMPKYVTKFYGAFEDGMSIWDENLEITNKIFVSDDRLINLPADELIKQSIDLSKRLSKDFIFVRVDWMIYKNKLYFEELTFTPHSGMQKAIETKLGQLIEL